MCEENCVSKRHVHRRLDQALVRRAALAGENASRTRSGYPPVQWKNLDRREKRELLIFTEAALVHYLAAK